MDEITAFVESLAVPWPSCPLCGETHPPQDECNPAWRVVRIADSVGFPSTGPRYYVDPETADTRA